MNATEIADVDRDVLTITTRGAHTWVTCTSGPNEVTVGPLPTTAITTALPGRPLTGPAPAAPSTELLEAALAAAVKDGHDARTRAERAEKERDEARATKNMHKLRADRERTRADAAENARDHWKREADGANDDLSHLRAAQSRPLTLDAITDDALDRAQEVWETAHGCEDVRVTLRRALAAALTEPPVRPEGAEEIEALLRDEWTFSDEDGGEEAFADLAQRLASRGVRVVTKEQP